MKKQNKKKDTNQNVSKQKNNRSILTRIFSKTKLSILLLVVELIVIIGLIYMALVFNYVWVNNLLLVLYLLSIVVCIAMVNSRMDTAYKVSWLFICAISNIVGATLFLLFANKKFTKKEKTMYKPAFEVLERATDSLSERGVSRDLDPIKNGHIANFARYIRKFSRTDTYENTKTTYFGWGELAHPVMLEKLRNAKHFIFMEYFIIQHGKMWDPIEEILIQKAKEGLDVRLLYDDLGCLNTLPADYDKYLNSLGVRCYKVSKIKPVFDVRMNNRDHRKIMVIDGHTGFTGGINLADEYINEVVRFGKWKDNAIMLEGPAVFGLTSLFLSSWILQLDNPDFTTDPATTFGYHVYAHEAPKVPPTRGYVAPYGSIPYTFETVGLNIYEMICYRARKYLYITTPYLILNKEMESAICNAAKSGVDVRIITPHIPDKKIVFLLTRAYYYELLRAGVKVYEYTPGFVHAKTFVADDFLGTVGTINLDYRSLFLHSENGVLLWNSDTIKDIKADFEQTLLVSQEITYDQLKNAKWYKVLFAALLKVFAPLL